MSAMYQTKDGRPISLKYTENSPREIGAIDGMSPWVVYRVSAFVEGMNVGWLDFSFIPHSRMESLLPTVWHYAGKILGWSDVKRALKEGNREALWKAVATRKLDWGAANRPPPVPAQQEKDLKIWAGEMTTSFEAFKAFHEDKPLVDYVKVEDDWQRQGIGTALYMASARWAAKLGMALYASGIQSNQAKHVWERFKHLKRIPLRTEMWGDKERTRIDYRVAARYLARIRLFPYPIL